MKHKSGDMIKAHCNYYGNKLLTKGQEYLVLVSPTGDEVCIMTDEGTSMELTADIEAAVFDKTNTNNKYNTAMDLIKEEK